MSEMPTTDRILDAAEHLFAEQGFSTSLRAITSAAAVNLAAVNYHFGSKDELIQAVFARRLEPLNRERLLLLDRIETDPADDTRLESVIEAFIGPAIRMSHDPQGATFMRLFGHTLSQHDDRIMRLFTDQLREVIDRFTAALGRALPHLERREVFWRMLFMVGSMAHTMALSDKLPAISNGLCEVADAEATIHRLVPFIAGGLRAQAPVLEPGVSR